MSKDTGGPAFPQAVQEWQGNLSGGGYIVRDLFGGMTLRDWFAGQAMAQTIKDYIHLPHSASILVERCYDIADAMIAERNKP